jgi:hypothetical protein
MNSVPNRARIQLERELFSLAKTDIFRAPPDGFPLSQTNHNKDLKLEVNVPTVPGTTVVSPVKPGFSISPTPMKLPHIMSERKLTISP